MSKLVSTYETEEAVDYSVAYAQFERLPKARVAIRVHFSKAVPQGGLTSHIRWLWMSYGWEIVLDAKVNQPRGILAETSVATYLAKPRPRTEPLVISSQQFSQLSRDMHASRTSLSSVSITPVPYNGTCLIRFTHQEGVGLPDFDDILLRTRELREARACPYGAGSPLDKVFRVHLAATDKKLPRIIDAIAFESRTWPTTASLSS